MRHSSMNGDGTMTTEKDARLTRMLRAVVWGGAVFAFLQKRQPTFEGR